MKNHTIDNQTPQRRAILVGIQLPRLPESELNSSLAELSRLVNTLGYEVVGRLTQKRASTTGAVVLGEGKLRELARHSGGSGVVASAVDVKKHKAALKFGLSADDEDDGFDYEEPVEIPETDAEDSGTDDLTDKPHVRADVIVFDCELSPSQMRNLESATGATVLDRTGVIIEIFSRHARTRAAQLQVEIARLNYMAPRMRETGGGADRQGGGIGGKGAGETSQELDRRRIRDRVKELKRDLETVQEEHSVRRSRRSTENCVALVGYTNAGKSSMMRAMTGSEVLIADKLFATLETTVRPVFPETLPKILLSDTVGFIKKLPHDLVASFKSTLDEALNADLLLYIVDASDPTFRSQLETTQNVLSEIGATTAPSRILLNKRDRISAEEAEALQKEFPEAILISTRISEDLASLREYLLNFFEQGMVEDELMVPYNIQGVIGELRNEMRVLSESFEGEGMRLHVRGKKDAIARIQKKIQEHSDAW